jgi:hypothetical protein
MKVITYKTINTINFPVYIILSENWDFSDGLLRLDGKVVDDKNMPGSSLGIRRIQSPFKDLYPLPKQIEDIRGIVKSGAKLFIDSSGTLFQYEKKVFCQLKYYKIKKVTKKDTMSVLWLHGVKFPFKIPRPPAADLQYAGVLHLNKLPWILYNYSEEKEPDSRKKV